ncbi:MAG: hypothetical protein ETSY1_23525 [Candidatus Entotheonella factor]|uniref:DUF1016 domain-containing protein n=1 Tax=Entotheonella factor TaxID=1429438 RepID=W4LGV3_ENTF1|nr:MAG: hypothetical protein ETSY1_23525 [Candidatus Entotheonella factor]
MVALPDDYDTLLEGLKTRIRQAQVKAALAVNRELVLLYWQIGKDILARQEREGWGAGVVGRLSNDLRKAFPGMKGLSARNLNYMRSFSEAYPDEQIVQQAAAQIPWFHNCVLLDKVKDPEQRKWYIGKTIENGWSRNVLVHHIDSRLYEREGKAITNFAATLPAPQSDLAQQLIKDPYHLDFLDITEEAKERDLEQALVGRIRDFLLELGSGFAFVGSQYPLTVDDEEFRIDLLFYHLRLRCFVVIELKTTAFKPEYAGKMNFYLAALDDLVKHPDDQPSIGIILCRSKGDAKVRYALQRINSPIGVSTHQLPKELEESLPTVEALEQELKTVDVEEMDED